MVDNNYNERETGKSDNAAKALGIAGIIIAVIALGWAVKADRHASDAAKVSLTSQQTRTTSTPASTNTSGTGAASTSGTSGAASGR